MGGRERKILKNIFSKYLKDRIYKMKQYLNYILMIINQNILAILKTFSNLQKVFMKQFAPRRQLPKLLLLNFLAKFLTERKYLMKNLTFVRRKYLYKITTSINSQTNESASNDGLTAEFYKHFSNELVRVLLDVYDSRGKLGTIGLPSRTGIISVKHIKM